MKLDRRSVVSISYLALVLVVLAVPTATSPDPDDDYERGSCGNCHSDYTPFTLVPTVPEDPLPGILYFEVLVINGEAELRDLSATIRGVEEVDEDELPAPFHDEWTGGLLPQGSDQQSVDVERHAISMTVTLDGDDGFTGINDLDLFVTGPSGYEWSSTSSTPDETIIIGDFQLVYQGPGTFDIRVDCLTGEGNIDYTLSVDVEYGAPVIGQKAGETIEPQKKFTFFWEIVVTQEELDRGFTCVVRGTPYYDHERGDHDEETYELEVDLGGGTDREALEENEETVLIVGRWFGFALLSLFIVTAILYLPIVRKPLAVRLGLEANIQVHCYAAAITAIVLIGHIALVLSSFYDLGEEAVWFGLAAMGFLVAATITGLLKTEFIERTGRRIWVWTHLLLTVAGVGIAFYHMLYHGEHFDFLWKD